MVYFLSKSIMEPINIQQNNRLLLDHLNSKLSYCNLFQITLEVNSFFESIRAPLILHIQSDDDIFSNYQRNVSILLLLCLSVISRS